MRKLMNVFFVAAAIMLTSTVANAQQKFAHINSPDILQLMPEVKTATATLETFSKGIQVQIDKMRNEAQVKYDAAIAKQKTMSEANKDVIGKELQQMQNELEEMGKRIQEAQTKAQQDVANKENELFAPIQKKANDAITSVAKEKGYAYVFDLSAAPGQTPTVIYWAGGDDITAAVKAKLGLSATATPAANKK